MQIHKIKSSEKTFNIISFHIIDIAELIGDQTKFCTALRVIIQRKSWNYHTKKCAKFCAQMSHGLVSSH